MNSAMDALRGPLPVLTGVPLRVAAYMRISEAIRAGVLGPSTLLPSEPELSELLGVSRTVVREALIFLEEDGLIRSRRGIGRFVSQQLPSVGLDQLQAPEVLFGAERGVSLQRVELVLQDEAAQFAAQALHLPERSPAWFAESVCRGDDAPIALIHEHVPADDHLTGVLAPLRGVAASSPADQSILAAILEVGVVPSSGTTGIAAGTPGAHRAQLLGLGLGEPIVIVTRTLQLGGSPFYTSKYLINHTEAHLSISHGSMRE